MIDAIDYLEYLVKKLYADRHPNRADWADWFYLNHVFAVADVTSELAYRFGANEMLARAGALLHDIADAVMSRFAPGHFEKSLSLARELMGKIGFDESEIRLVVDDAIRFHSCHDGQIPASLEGRVLATADGVCHLRSGFYNFAIQAKARSTSIAEANAWALAKIGRDWAKILIEEVRAECQHDYASLLAALDS